MIKLIKKTDCCGCESCRQTCPIQCISMKEDEYGFLYPYASNLCIKCGKCLDSCPIWKEYKQK